MEAHYPRTCVGLKQYTIEGSNFVLYKNFWVWIKVMGFLVEPETQYFVYNNDTKG